MYVEVFFIAISTVGAAVGLMLNIVDARPGRFYRVLNSAAKNAAKVGATTPIVRKRQAARAEAEEGTGSSWRLSPALPRKLTNNPMMPPQRTFSSTSLSSQQ